MTSESDLRPHCHIPGSTSTHLIGLAGNMFAYQGIIFVFQNRPAMSDAEFGRMSFKEPEVETKRGPAQPHCGGHYNPAVSLGAWLVGGLNMVMVIPYWISQLCGGMIGAGLAKVTTVWERYENATGGAFTAITSDPQLPAAVVGEIVMTMLLVMAVCMGAINEKTKSPLAPFCIGLTVTVDILAGGAVSGACMNPARAFGPAVAANHWDYHWVYWVGPMGAALLVGALIRVLLGDSKTRFFLK
ncbi:aquaporin-8 isoform X3 [Notechis scutatus]|uniref:Aquaporin-8 isoform X3 n=1 Tax=Notechis scutatus TaxID=8663 RepID=A0A6J1V7Z1_9SAUR|nr:aquaporin-8 isoform X3 [Notechis scutatus]